MGAARSAGLAAGLAIALASLTGAAGVAEDAKTFLGYRLLDLDNQSVKWRTPTFGRGAVVTYAFAEAPVTTPGARNCGQMLPPEHAYGPSDIGARQFRREVAAAFRMWEKVADISFEERSDTGASDILIGAQAVPLGRAFTNVELKPGTGDKKVIGRSLICLNPKQPWKVGFDGRLQVYDLRYTIAHEIGHAIGLDHPSAAGQLMSYRYDEKQAGLQPGDVRGAVMLYGARSGSRSVLAAENGGANSNEAPEGESGWPFGIGVNRGALKAPAR